jgi:hypothetical protein
MQAEGRGPDEGTRCCLAVARFIVSQIVLESLRGLKRS